METSKLEKFDSDREMDPKKFSGTVFTIVYKPHQGFADFAVATITINKGVLTKVTIGDPYVGFEASMHLEIANDKLLANMRKNYPAGFRHV